MTEPVRHNETSCEVTVDSVDANALELLESDPPEYFRRTHKRLPFGFSSSRTSPAE